MILPFSCKKLGQMSKFWLFEVKFGLVLFSPILLKFSLELFLRSGNSLIRSDLHGFAIFQEKNWVQRSKFWLFQVKFVPKFLPLTPFLTLKMTKLCKSGITSKFLDLESCSGENYSKIKEQRYRTKYDLKESKIMLKNFDIWPHFWPRNR